MKLSTLAILLGVAFCLPQIYGLKNPEGFRNHARAFPRSIPLGWLLMAIGTGWFLFNLKNERISDFAAYKDLMLAGFAGIGVATCIFVKDFLAARGLAIVLMMLAKYTVDLARWVENDWRLVLVTWAYIWVVGGIWVTVSPWKLRDWIHWMTETPGRIRVGCAARLAFGLGVAALGAFVL